MRHIQNFTSQNYIWTSKANILLKIYCNKKRTCLQDSFLANIEAPFFPMTHPILPGGTSTTDSVLLFRNIHNLGRAGYLRKHHHSIENSIWSYSIDHSRTGITNIERKKNHIFIIKSVHQRVRYMIIFFPSMIISL